MRWIPKLYQYDTYRSCDKQPSISATGLLGPLYKAKLQLEGVEKDNDLVELQFKRSSMIGTAVHERAEKAFADDKSVVQEIYIEREIEIDGTTYTISGSCDLLQKEDNGTYTIADWKTGYGKDRKQDALGKDAMQMSIYRWLLQDDYTINDTAYILFISQSNNAQQEYPVELKSLDHIEEFIENKIWSALQQEVPDCNDSVKYNSCTYCSFVCSRRQ